MSFLKWWFGQVLGTMKLTTMLAPILILSLTSKLAYP